MNIETVINNRYHILSSLGQGNMGEVYLVDDRLMNHNQIALKVIKKSIILDKYKADLLNFKHEFDVMTRLRHPNLIEVYDFGQIEKSNLYYFTMEYVKGISLKQRLEENRGFTEDEILILMVDACRALSFIHARNIFHRDINPNNIMLAPGIKIMDFGLADLSGSESTKSKGTLLYIDPEVARGNIGTFTDIFSLGLTFYELLTGKIFYDQYDARHIIQLIHNEENFNQYKDEKLENIKNRALRTIIDKMTTYNPQKRYRSCTQIIMDINSLYDKQFELETRQTRHAYVYAPGFIGRETEFTYLKNLIQDPKQFAVTLYGNAGIGKSRLMKEFKKYCQLNSIVFTEGSCYEDRTSLYGPFILILEQLLLHATESVIKRFGVYLKKVLPDNTSLKEIEAVADIEPKEERMRIINHITEFILTCTLRANKPTIICLNDIHWSDDATLGIIELLIMKKYAPNYQQSKLKVIMTSRHEGLSMLKPLHDFDIYKELALKPFDQDNVKKYIDAIFGDNMSTENLQAAIPFINRKIGGNPFFLQVLIKSLVNNNTISRSGILWDIKDSIEHESIPENLNQLIIARLEYLNLDKDETSLLEVISLLNKEMTITELGQITKVDDTILKRLAMYELVNSSIRENDRYYEVAHDLIRENIITNISDKKNMHNTIATNLENLESQNEAEYTDELAHHYYYGENKEKALFYLEQSAVNAKKRYDLKHSITIYTQILSLLAEHEIEKKIEVLFFLTEPYRLLSQYDAFLRTADKAIALSESIGNKKIPAEIYINIGRYYFDLREFKNALLNLEKSLELFEELQDKSGLIYAHNYIGFNQTMLNNYDLATEHLEKSLKLAYELNDTRGIAYSSGNMGLLFFYQGKFENAISNLKNSIAMCHEIGTLEDELYGYGNISEIYFHIGDFVNAHKYVDIGIKRSNELGANRIITILNSLKADILFARGNIDEAEVLNNSVRSMFTTLNIINELFDRDILRAKILQKKNKREEAMTLLDHLLHEATAEEKRARAHYELWKITKLPDHKNKALSIYYKICQSSNNILFKKYINDMQKTTINKNPRIKRNFYD